MATFNVSGSNVQTRGSSTSENRSYRRHTDAKPSLLHYNSHRSWFVWVQANARHWNGYVIVCGAVTKTMEAAPPVPRRGDLLDTSLGENTNHRLITWMDSCIHLSFQYYTYVCFISTFKCTKKVGMTVSSGYLQGGEPHRERKGMGALTSYSISICTV